MSFSKSIVYVSVAVVCTSIILSAIYTRTRKHTNVAANIADHQSVSGKKDEVHRNHGPFPSRKTESKAEGTGAGLKKSWASTFLPFYSLGILAYVAFVVGKIMNKKYTRKRKSENLSWKKSGLRKGNGKTKITMHEIRQLEEKLQETELAVQEILLKANVTMETVSDRLERDDSSEDETTHSLPKRAKRTKNIRRVSTESDTASERDLSTKKDLLCSKLSNHRQYVDLCTSNASDDNSSTDNEPGKDSGHCGSQNSTMIKTSEVFSAKIATADNSQAESS